MAGSSYWGSRPMLGAGAGTVKARPATQRGARDPQRGVGGDGGARDAVEGQGIAAGDIEDAARQPGARRAADRRPGLQPPDDDPEPAAAGAVPEEGRPEGG